MYREGILLTKINHVLPYYDDVEDAFINYVYNFYQDHIIPKQIVMPDLNGVDLLSEVLEVDIITPSRGTRQELLTIAAQNAIEAMKQKFALTFDDDKDKIELLDEFASLIGVSSLHQIEMVDISHLQGSDAVGAVVVFTNGEPNKREYRRYKINQENTKDDTASMYEVMYRRYYRRLTEQGKYSNLIIVDGGIMQINAVKKAFDALNINIKVVGLVKDEHHRTRALVDSDGKEISLTDNKQLLFLLTRMQDEVHRFAIAYHHNLRRKSMTSSILDEVPGIGEKRKHKLIRAFGSVEKMKEVPLSELEQYLPHEVAVNLKQKLDNQ
jgi:excinuclease ABC subunit C